MVLTTFAAAAALMAMRTAPVAVLAQEPTTATTTTTQTTSQTQFFSTFPQPEQGYVTTLYNRIPVANQPAFITWLQGFQPDQQRLIIRTLNAYSLGGPNVTRFDESTTPDVAMPVFVTILGPDDQPTFRTMWTGMPAEQQTTFVTMARYVYPEMPAATPQTPVDTTPPDTTTTTTPDVSTTTTSTTTMTTGSAGQPFTTVAFSAFLPSAARTAFETMAPTVPSAELGGMQYFLSQLQPEQAGMIVRALSAINQQGISGNSSADRGGVTDNDARALLLSQVDAGDRSSFEGMWNGMSSDQRFILMQLARDAYNGGFNDMGPNAATGGNTTTTTTTSP